VFQAKYGSRQSLHPASNRNGETRVRRICGHRFDFSPRQALYYNDHPDAIIEDFEQGQYSAVLREIERHVIEWERQQTAEQAEWVAQARRRTHLSTRAAAATILKARQF
jgi:hypothetical protein